MTAEEEVIHPPSDRKALEWITALAADGLPYRLTRRGPDWQLSVPAVLGERARATIAAFEEVNVGWPPQPVRWTEPSPQAHPVWSGIWGAAFIIMVFVCFGPYDAEIPQLRAASSDAFAIMAGEWWRPITALTLHAGFAHLAGNALFLAILGGFVCRSLGVGVGWLLILVSGIAGNLLVAFAARDTGHIAVGASTACFGALGILALHQAVENLHRFGNWKSVWSRTWVPLCGGLAMLGLLGSDPNSDIGAHGAGFLCGLAVAVPFSLQRGNMPPAWAQDLLKLVTLLLIMVAWRAAMHAPA